MRDARESVAVVVVTYNRADLLERMLDGLAALTIQPDAVLVIDNASTDHTPQVLADAALPGLQVIRTAENLGFDAVLTPTGTPCEDAWIVASALIPETERLKFLVALRPGLISPTLLAQMA